MIRIAIWTRSQERICGRGGETNRALLQGTPQQRQTDTKLGTVCRRSVRGYLTVAQTSRPRQVALMVKLLPVYSVSILPAHPDIEQDGEWPSKRRRMAGGFDSSCNAYGHR